MSTLLDHYIQRFQNLPSFNIYAVMADGMSAVPWMEVQGQDIARELIFDEMNTVVQTDTISADIQKWGRLESQARRVWEMAERELLRWKSQFILDMTSSPGEGEEKLGWGTTAKGEPKAPTVEGVKTLYRVNPEYHHLNRDIERAEEAFNATHSVLEGFRAKKDMMARFAKRYRDG